MEGTCAGAYLTLCDDYHIEPPWDILGSDERALRGPADPAAALARLRQRHSDDRLVEAGLATRDPSGGLAIHPHLAQRHVPILSIGARRYWCDSLLTRHGNIQTPEPIFAALDDYSTVQRLNHSSGQLCLAGDLEDAILLRALGHAAVPIAGVDRLDYAGLTLLAANFDVEIYDDDDEVPIALGEGESLSVDDDGAESEPSSYQLVVCDWSLRALTLTRPHDVGAALHFFGELQNHLAIDVSRCRVWRPTQQRLDSIQFALERRDLGWLTNAIGKSLRDDVRSLGSDRLRALPPDLLKARDQMLQAFAYDSRDPWANRRQQQALETYRAIVERDINQPLYERAQAVADPRGRAMDVCRADLQVIQHELIGALRELILRSKREPNPASHEEQQRILSQIIALDNQLLRHSKDILSWEKLRNGRSRDSWRWDGW